MERPRTRYLAGVCEALGLKLKINPIIIRILFIITTLILFIITTPFLLFPLLVYIVLCFTIPNYQKVHKNQKIIYQFIGFLFGIIGLALIGIIVGYLAEDMIMMMAMMGGGVVILYLWAIISFFGGLLGLIIGRSIAERKENEKTPILTTKN